MIAVAVATLSPSPVIITDGADPYPVPPFVITMLEIWPGIAPF